MKPPRRGFLRLARAAANLAVISAALLSASHHGAFSQATTIKIVVPFPPGGPTDILARLLAEQIGRTQGPAMAVENRPGASSVIGTEAVLRAAPDGNTLLINSPSFIINPRLQNLGYDPLTSFEPICYLATSPTAIVVNAASSYRTLPDLLDAARAKPGELTLASIGPGSVTHIGFEMLKRVSGTAMTFVPYPGMAPAVNALLGEHVTAAWVDFQVAGEQIRAGKLRPLAAIAQTRIEKLPDVPTVAELGYGDIRADPWFGVVAPARTPKEMLSGLIGRFTAALRDPEVKGKLEALGLYPVGLCGADFGAFMRQLNDDYGRVIREANIKPQ